MNKRQRERKFAHNLSYTAKKVAIKKKLGMDLNHHSSGDANKTDLFLPLVFMRSHEDPQTNRSQHCGDFQNSCLQSMLRSIRIRLPSSNENR